MLRRTVSTPSELHAEANASRRSTDVSSASSQPTSPKAPNNSVAAASASAAAASKIRRRKQRKGTDPTAAAVADSGGAAEAVVEAAVVEAAVVEAAATAVEPLSLLERHWRAWFVDSCRLAAAEASECANLFIHARVAPDQTVSLTHELLREIGVRHVGVRMRIIGAPAPRPFLELRPKPIAAVQSQSRTTTPRTARTSSEDLATLVSSDASTTSPIAAADTARKTRTRHKTKKASTASSPLRAEAAEVTAGAVPDDERVVLNVGGTRFETYLSTLTQFPNTTLGAMFSERNRPLLRRNKHGEVFFDRSPALFEPILAFYRTGVLRRPPHVDPRLFAEECAFFGVGSARKGAPRANVMAMLGFGVGRDDDEFERSQDSLGSYEVSDDWLDEWTEDERAAAALSIGAAAAAFDDEEELVHRSPPSRSAPNSPPLIARPPHLHSSSGVAAATSVGAGAAASAAGGGGGAFGAAASAAPDEPSWSGIDQLRKEQRQAEQALRERRHGAHRLGSVMAARSMSRLRQKVSGTLRRLLRHVVVAVRRAADVGHTTVTVEFREGQQPEFYAFLSNLSYRELALHELYELQFDVAFKDVTSAGGGHSYVFLITLWNCFTGHESLNVRVTLTRVLEELRFISSK
jgi:hypothetical protein